MVFQTVTLPAPGFLLHVLYIIVEKNQNGERLTPETRGRTMHGKKETLRFSKKKTGAFASQLGLTPHRDCYKSHGWGGIAASPKSSQRSQPRSHSPSE